MAANYQEYVQQMRKIADIRNASAVLQWDQETYLPTKGSAFRGQQIATLNETAHALFTDPGMGELLGRLAESNLPEDKMRNVSITKVDYERAKKLKPEFVRKMSEAVNRSFHSWVKAKQLSDFKIFRTDLDSVIKLKREEANYIGYEKHPYDALMDEFDRGLTVGTTDQVFDSLKPELQKLLKTVNEGKSVDASFLEGNFPKEKQWNFGLELIKKLHFDMDAGRQDLSEHPFSTSFNCNDVRITTRIDETDLANMTWSCIHEVGHALYEQGLPEQYYGLPLGEYCSLSIHESQSRLWENNVGRSRSFWEKNFGFLTDHFPDFKTVGLENFYKGINKVSPSLIRTEADELTYHFHIMIRYELEKRLIEGSMKTEDIPAYWNDLYREFLGIEVPDDRRGCLQDVHWSHGSFGYFATYSLGSLYAAQFYAAICRENESVRKDVGNHTQEVLTWLRQHIHQFGRYYNSGELCKEATGESLQSQYFINYATEKFSDIYK